MTALRCQICNSEDTKYKCTTCRAPRYAHPLHVGPHLTILTSCSLPCFKQHKEACAGRHTEQPSTPQLGVTGQLLEDNANGDTKSATIDPADLKDLFQRYPGLQSQLREIYKSTRDPSETSQNGNGRDFSRRYWNPEKGFENGLTALRRLAEDESLNSEGIAAFMELLAGKSTV